MDRGANHDLMEMIFMALTATMCGANGWADVERFVKAKRDWFERFLPLEHGLPSHDTFGRVFARLDTAEFLRRCTAGSTNRSKRPRRFSTERRTICRA
jgi:hypothetical protein